MSPQELDKPLIPEENIASRDERATAEPRVSPRGKRLKYILLAIASALVMILIGTLVRSPTNPKEYLSSWGYAGAFIMGFIGSASPIWPLPGSWAAFIAAGLGLNPLLVGLAAGLGEPLGELAGYTAGYGGQVTIQKWKRYTQIENWMRRHGGATIFVISAIPNFFVKLATIAAGALRYPLWRFFLFCWAGKTIKSLAFAFAGAGLFAGIKELIGKIF